MHLLVSGQNGTHRLGNGGGDIALNRLVRISLHHSQVGDDHPITRVVLTGDKHALFKPHGVFRSDGGAQLIEDRTEDSGVYAGPGCRVFQIRVHARKSGLHRRFSRC